MLYHLYQFHIKQIYIKYCRYKVQFLFNIVTNPKWIITFAVFYNIFLSNIIYCEEYSTLQKAAWWIGTGESLIDTEPSKTHTALDQFAGWVGAGEFIQHTSSSSSSESDTYILTDSHSDTNSEKDLESTKTSSGSESDTELSSNQSDNPLSYSTESGESSGSESYTNTSNDNSYDFYSMYQDYESVINQTEKYAEVPQRAYDFMRRKFPEELFSKTENELTDPMGSMNRFQDNALGNVYNRGIYSGLRASLNAYNIIHFHNRLDDQELFEDIYHMQFDLIFKSIPK